MSEEIKSFEDMGDAPVEAVVAEEVIAREPVRDELGRSYATGKRKDAVARVWVKPGNGEKDVHVRRCPSPIVETASSGRGCVPAGHWMYRRLAQVVR